MEISFETSLTLITSHKIDVEAKDGTSACFFFFFSSHIFIFVSPSFMSFACHGDHSISLMSYDINSFSFSHAQQSVVHICRQKYIMMHQSPNKHLQMAVTWTQQYMHYILLRFTSTNYDFIKFEKNAIELNYFVSVIIIFYRLASVIKTL